MNSMMPGLDAAVHARISQLMQAQPVGRSPVQGFYTDAEIFRQDMDRFLMKHWILAGHISMVPDPGDFFLVNIAEESVIISRDREGEIRALVNVCRHRGSRVCLKESGNAKLFVCPYHAWVYNSDGTLRGARDMGPDFDRSQHGLHQLQVRVVQGMIYYTFATEPLGFDEAAKVIEHVGSAYGWAEAKIAARKTYKIAANWKLAVENYLECYHCGPSHPEFSHIHSNDQAPEKVANLFNAMEERAHAQGIELPELDKWADWSSPGQEGIYVKRFALFEGAQSGSREGEGLAPLMGKFREYDGGTTYMHVGPVSYYLSYPDHTVIYRFTPKTVQEAEMEILWLVDGSAEEGKDYDPATLTWMWDVTSQEDKRITEDNQRGVNSRYYEPGPLAGMEGRQARFCNWYLDAMANG